MIYVLKRKIKPESNRTEMIKLIEIKTKEGNIIVANIYIPSPTRIWEKDRYRELVENTTRSIRILLQTTEDRA